MVPPLGCWFKETSTQCLSVHVGAAQTPPMPLGPKQWGWPALSVWADRCGHWKPFRVAAAPVL